MNKDQAKEWCINITKNYIESKRWKYSVEEKNSGSVYINIEATSSEYGTVRIRISDHAHIRGYVHTIRYDRFGKNTPKKKIKDKIIREINNEYEKTVKYSLNKKQNK